MIPLYGHDAAVAAFRDGLDSGRLHHAWLISGPQGVGKGLFAAKAALRVLAEGAGPMPKLPGLDVEDEHPAARLFAAWSHPDFRLLDRLPREPKERDQARVDWPDNVELARSIKIDQVRALHRLFDMRPSLSERRVVIIDSADDLEGEGSTNALLKMLEEPPPHTVFFLVSRRPESLKATIRSRCSALRLKPLADAEMARALHTALPDAADDEIGALVRVGEGSPGRAIAFRGLDIGGLDRALDALAAEGDPTNARRVKLAQSLALKAAQPRYEAFLSRAPSLIAARARDRKGAPLAEALRLWERAQALAGSAVPLSLEPHSVVFELAGLVAGLAPKSPSREREGSVA